MRPQGVQEASGIQARSKPTTGSLYLLGLTLHFDFKHTNGLCVKIHILTHNPFFISLGHKPIRKNLCNIYHDHTRVPSSGQRHSSRASSSSDAHPFPSQVATGSTSSPTMSSWRAVSNSTTTSLGRLQSPTMPARPNEYDE